MASFCWDCAPEMWECEPEENDIRDPRCPEGHMFYDICERCGPGWFDREGRKIASIWPPAPASTMDAPGQGFVIEFVGTNWSDLGGDNRNSSL